MHGGNQIENYPESILVYVKVGGVVVAQRTVTASDHWTYIFRLPKYDGDGKEIVYTIDEEKVPGYQKTVDGYDLINTYDPTTLTALITGTEIPAEGPGTLIIRMGPAVTRRG